MSGSPTCTPSERDEIGKLEYTDHSFFYKNIIWTISMFWFLIYNSFDATYLFEYTFLLLFNLVFTSLPVGVMGAFDQDTHATASMAFPALYQRGIKGLEYTRTRFWIYMTDGLYQSCIIFFIPYLAYAGGTPWSSNGMDTDSLWDFGTTIACAGVISANMYVGINMNYWTFVTWVVIVGSSLLVFIWIPIYSALSDPPFNGVVSVIYPTFSFWAIIVITVFFAIGPRWLANAFRQSYFPRDKDIVREAWVAGNLKDELGIQHRKERKRAKKAMKVGNESTPPTFISHVQQAFGDDPDGRGQYQRANIASPQKSPAVSGTSTPRSPFSYPPRSPSIDRAFELLSPSPRGSTTVPPPLHLHARGSEGSISRPANYNNRNGLNDDRVLGTNDQTSPNGLDAFNLTGKEVHRLSQASMDLRRASLQTTMPSPLDRANSQKRESGVQGGYTWNGAGARRDSTLEDPLGGYDDFGRQEGRAEENRKSYVDFSAPRGQGW